MTETIQRLNSALEGRYRIERQLGAGGMATVYLADDLKHNRRVAIKVLKPELAAVVGKERFFAEIETTAQLQHPNILPLFDSGEADGLLFYAMPYVEGETLEDQLAREHQLPVDTALDIARKLAAALDYAHQRGVVHRDVKPANILISSGEPLIADFGIALAVTHAGDGRITETGLSLGTPHYMSPEQASGDRSLDPRSDVYALGCVLYEMLTGDPPFPGSSAQAVLARILTSAPSRVTLGRPTVPQHVDAVIARALEKLPADRFATAGDFRKALNEPSFRHVTTLAAASERAAPAGIQRRTRPLVPALGGLLAVSLALAAWGWLRPAPAAPVQRFRLDVEAGEFTGRDITISPDGSRVVYVGPDLQLYQRPLNALESVPIAGARPARAPFFSPDGNSIGFNFGPLDSDRINTVVLSGGSPISIGNANASVATSGAWLEDDYIYYFEDRNPEDQLMRVSAQGGVAEPVETDGSVHLPAAIPGVTDRLLVTISDGEIGIGMLDLGTGAAERIAGLENSVDALYAGGFVFWLTVDGALVAARFDPDGGQLTSVPVTLAEGVLPGGYTVSRAGILIFRGGTSAANVIGETPGWITRNGETEIINQRLGADITDFDDVRISEDGRYLALEIQRNADGSANEEHRVLIYDLEQKTSYQLTFEGRFNRTPRWMPDNRVAYASDQGGRGGIWAQPFDRSGSESAIFQTEYRIDAFDVSPKAGAPLVVALSPENDSSGFRQGIYLVDEGSDTPRPLVASRFRETAPSISPDGRWLAYTSDESGRDEVYVRAFPGGGRPWPIATEESVAPLWGPAGDEIFYVTPGGGLMMADLDLTDGVRVTARSMLFNGNYELSRGGTAGYDVAADGRVAAVFERSAQVAGTSAEELPIVVLNVFEELRQRLGESGGR